MADNLTNAQILARLDIALRQMPARRRAIFLAIRRDGLSYAELAKQLGLTVPQIEREVAAALLDIDDTLHDRRRLSLWQCLRRAVGGKRSR